MPSKRLDSRALFIAAIASIGAGCARAPVTRSDGSAPVPAAVPLMEPDPAYLLPAGERSFRVRYTAVVEPVPAGTKRLQVWVPVPRSDRVQRITELEFQGPPPSLRNEWTFGNRIAYYQVDAPGERFEASYSFVCTRREVRVALGALDSEGEEHLPMERYLAPERLVVVDDRIREIADGLASGSSDTVTKARAIYGYVLDHMSYDKSGTGWGHGDTRRACETGRGNCTDYHALFDSLCRAAGIAAGFEIGLYLPYERGSKETLGSYHCWAWFRVPGRTWVPVDASEADREPGRLDYFFGALTPNRVTLSAGRDLVLDPPQRGEPLEFFLAPYAEADGSPFDGASKQWTAEDLDPPQ